MAAMDDGLMAPSDAELDSDVEDADIELNHHSSWATQGSAGPSCFKRASSTRMSTASRDAFKPSLDNNGVMTVDFDSILSELCDLEHQLNEQSILNASSPDPSASVHPVHASTTKKSPENSVIFKDYTNLKSTTSPHKVSSNNAAAAAKLKPTQMEIGRELDVALSELSSLVGSAFDVDANSRPCSNQNGRRNEVDAPSDLKNTYKNNHFQNARQSNHANNNVHARSNSMEHCGHPRKSSSTILSGGGGGGVAQNHWQEHLSDGGQNDSAFDDNVSLPSSGSRVSMATSSRSSGSSITNNTLGSSNEVDETLRSRSDPSKTNNHSNQNKIFVRVYSPEGSSESILVTEQMTVSQVIDNLLTKSHAQLDMSWSLVEQLPNLLMERLLEDSECLTDNVLTWTKDSENKLVLVERPDKYDVFLCPERYLTTMEDKNKKCDENVRKVLIQEFLESNCRLPEFDGMLYIKLDGKKAWKKLYFILRASGIYYNPRGKSKSLIDLVCLQKLSLVEVYTGIGWKKKYKAPTDFGFALKHPQIQKKTPKYIKYLCAEDMTSMWHWINCIRLAKYGQQLHMNFRKRQSALHNSCPDAVDSVSKLKQAALIQEKISEMFSQQSESVPSFSCAAQQSPSPSLQTFRAESPDDSPARLLKSCLEANGSASSAKMTPLIPITTQITKQLSGQQTLRSPAKVPPKSPKKVVKEMGSEQLPPAPHVASNNTENGFTNSSNPQLQGNEMLHHSTDQLHSSGSPTFNALKMAPPVATGKWGTSQKHAVIKRAPSIGHREVDDPLLPCPQVCALPPKPVPLVAPSAEVTVLPSPNSLPPVRRKFPSSSSFSDCDEGRILLTPQSSPKPKPPLPPKRKDILKPSPSVDSSPTKGHVAAIAGSLNLAKKPVLDIRPSSTSSSQQSLSPRSPSPGGLKQSPSRESGQTSSFLMDLQRVISQKQACGVGGLTDVPVSPVPAPCDVDLDSLPPPPAALLDGLKNLKKCRPPPPPKRSQETQLTYK